MMKTNNDYLLYINLLLKALIETFRVIDKFKKFSFLDLQIHYFEIHLQLVTG